MAYRIRDRRTEAALAEAAAVLVTDVPDPGAVNVQRLRHLLMPARRCAPLIVVPCQDTPQSRLRALALGASRTLKLAADAAYAILQGMMGRLDPALVTAFHPIATAFTPSFPCDI